MGLSDLTTATPGTTISLKKKTDSYFSKKIDLYFTFEFCNILVVAVAKFRPLREPIEILLFNTVQFNHIIISVNLTLLVLYFQIKFNKVH